MSRGRAPTLTPTAGSHRAAGISATKPGSSMTASLPSCNSGWLAGSPRHSSGLSRYAKFESGAPSARSRSDACPPPLAGRETVSNPASCVCAAAWSSKRRSRTVMLGLKLKRSGPPCAGTRKSSVTSSSMPWPGAMRTRPCTRWMAAFAVGSSSAWTCALRQVWRCAKPSAASQPMPTGTATPMAQKAAPNANALRRPSVGRGLTPTLSARKPTAANTAAPRCGNVSPVPSARKSEGSTPKPLTRLTAGSKYAGATNSPHA